MKKLFFALAVSLSALTACSKSKDNPRDGFIGNYSIVITEDATGSTVSTANQVCAITASSTGDANITIDGLFLAGNTGVVTATVNSSIEFSIPLQLIGTASITGYANMDINKNITLQYGINTIAYSAALTRI